MRACVVGILAVVFALIAGGLPAQTASVRIAIIQYQVQEEDKVGVDGDRVEAFIRKAAADGARLVIAPETCFYRYSPWEQNGVSMADLAAEYPALERRFAALAKELKIALVIGLREPHSEKKVYNTALFFGPDGALLGRHRKTIPSSGEAAWTVAGKEAEPFDTPFGKVGMLICKDAKTGRARTYNDRGVDLYILIAGDDDGTSFGSFGQTCRDAKCFGVLCNQVTKHGKGKGNSATAGPDGKVSFLGGGEQVFLAELPLKGKAAAASGSPFPPSPVIREVEFEFKSHRRLAPGSDNWPITWADDDRQYAVWGDGGGFGGTNSAGRVSLGVARIEGGADDFKTVNVFGGQDAQNKATFGGKSYGMVCVGGALYMWVGPGSGTASFAEARLYRSTDQGATWTKADWAFRESDGIVMPTICQFGKDYAGARDDYVYSYWIGLAAKAAKLEVQKPGKVFLSRVHRDRIMSRDAYEFFTGLDDRSAPAWSDDLAKRRPVFEDPNGVGWCVSVSYNPGLKRYLLATEHNETCKGNLGLFDAPEPWGSWTTVGYWDNWGGFGSTFYWNFSNKWLSADGRRFTLIFTGTGANDSWNTVSGSFTVADELLEGNDR